MECASNKTPLTLVIGPVHRAPARRIEPMRSLTTAWLGGCALFLGLGIVTPIDMRHYLAALPALAMLIGVALAMFARLDRWGVAAVIVGLGWMGAQAAISWMAALGGI